MVMGDSSGQVFNFTKEMLIMTECKERESWLLWDKAAMKDNLEII